MGFNPKDFSPPTLPTSEEELRTGAAARAAEPSNDPRNQKVWIFQFEYEDQKKAKKTGTFTNKILNLADRTKVDVFAAQLGGGLPFNSLDPISAERNRALAWLSLSLAEDRPSWAKNLFEIEDEALLFSLWEKIQSHERFYFRGGEG